MAKLDWTQPAILRLLNRRGSAPGEAPIIDGSVVSHGTLADAVTAFRSMSRKDQKFARLEIAFDFHLDGLEIAQLKDVSR